MFLARGPTAPYYFSEDPESLTWAYPANNIPQGPKWEFRHKEGQYDNTIVTYDAIIIKYAGSGDVRVYLPDNEGNPRSVFKQTLPAPMTGKLRAIKVPLVWSGKGASATLELLSGDLQIAKFQMAIEVRSENPSRADSDMQDYIGFWDTP
jgi:hypothetical protein